MYYIDESPKTTEIKKLDTKECEMHNCIYTNFKIKNKKLILDKCVSNHKKSSSRKIIKLLQRAGGKFLRY